MPVQLWDHIQDPLDVDKSKQKKAFTKNTDPYANTATVHRDESKFEVRTEQNLLDDEQDPKYVARQEKIKSTMNETIQPSEQKSVSAIAKVQAGIEEAKSFHAQDASYNLNFMMDQLDQQNKLLQTPNSNNNVQIWDLKDKSPNNSQFVPVLEIKQTIEEFQVIEKSRTKSSNSRVESLKKPKGRHTKQMMKQNTQTVTPALLEQQAVDESNEFVTLSDLKAKFEEQQDQLNAELKMLGDPARIQLMKETMKAKNFEVLPQPVQQQNSQQTTPAKSVAEQQLPSGIKEDVFTTPGIFQAPAHIATASPTPIVNETPDLVSPEKAQMLEDLQQWQNNNQMLQEQEEELREQLENIQIIREHMTKTQQQVMNTHNTGSIVEEVVNRNEELATQMAQKQASLAQTQIVSDVQQEQVKQVVPQLQQQLQQPQPQYNIPPQQQQQYNMAPQTAPQQQQQPLQQLPVVNITPQPAPEVKVEPIQQVSTLPFMAPQQQHQQYQQNVMAPPVDLSGQAAYAQSIPLNQQNIGQNDTVRQLFPPIQQAPQVNITQQMKPHDLDSQQNVFMRSQVQQPQQPLNTQQVYQHQQQPTQIQQPVQIHQQQVQPQYETQQNFMDHQQLQNQQMQAVQQNNQQMEQQIPQQIAQQMQAPQPQLPPLEQQQQQQQNYPVQQAQTQDQTVNIAQVQNMLQQEQQTHNDNINGMQYNGHQQQQAILQNAGHQLYRVSLNSPQKQPLPVNSQLSLQNQQVRVPQLQESCLTVNQIPQAIITPPPMKVEEIQFIQEIKRPLEQNKLVFETEIPQAYEKQQVLSPLPLHSLQYEQNVIQQEIPQHYKQPNSIHSLEQQQASLITEIAPILVKRSNQQNPIDDEWFEQQNTEKHGLIVDYHAAQKQPDNFSAGLRMSNQNNNRTDRKSINAVVNRRNTIQTLQMTNLPQNQTLKNSIEAKRKSVQKVAVKNPMQESFKQQELQEANELISKNQHNQRLQFSQTIPSNGMKRTAIPDDNDYIHKDLVNEQIQDLNASIAKISNKLSLQQQTNSAAKIGGLARRRSTKRISEIKKSIIMNSVGDPSPGMRSIEETQEQVKDTTVQREVLKGSTQSQQEKELEPAMVAPMRQETTEIEVDNQIKALAYQNLYQAEQQNREENHIKEKYNQRNREEAKAKIQAEAQFHEQQAIIESQEFHLKQQQREMSSTQQKQTIKHQLQEQQQVLMTQTAQDFGIHQRSRRASAVRGQKQIKNEKSQQQFQKQQSPPPESTPGGASTYKTSNKDALMRQHELYQQRKRRNSTERLEQVDLDHETKLLESYLASPKGSQKTQSVYKQKESSKIRQIEKEHRIKEQKMKDSYENKQQIIQANLDQIGQLEWELNEARRQQRKQEQQLLAQKKVEAKKAEEELVKAREQKGRAMELKQRAIEIACQTSSKTLPLKTPVTEKSKATLDEPDLSQVTNNRPTTSVKSEKKEEYVPEKVVKPKKGMVNAGQQLGVGNVKVENPRNSLNPLLLQTGEPSEDGQLVDKGMDPKTREQETNARARDMATDPMICEKSTDPKMQDIATDAWKRDGGMQTLKEADVVKQQEHMARERAAEAERKRIATALEQQEAMDMGQSEPVEAVPLQKPGMVNNGGTQYSLAAAADVKETTNESVAVIVENEEDLKSLPENMKDQIISEQQEDVQDVEKAMIASPAEAASQDGERPNLIVVDPSQKSIENIQDANEKSMSLRDELNSRNRIQKSEKRINEKVKREIRTSKDQRQEEKTWSRQSKSPPSATETPKVQRAQVIQEKHPTADASDVPGSLTSVNGEQELPIYHDHLLEEVMEQKIRRQKSRDQTFRNDSRSTQQMFENQLKGKDRFTTKRGTQQPTTGNEANLTIIQQSVQNALPPIGGRVEETVNQQNGVNQSPGQNARHNFENFRTPKAKIPYNQALQNSQNNAYARNQYQNGILPPTEMRDPNSQIPTVMSQAHQQAQQQQFYAEQHNHHEHEKHHKHGKKKCSACVRRRTRRQQAKAESVGPVGNLVYDQNQQLVQRQSLPPPAHHQQVNVGSEQGYPQQQYSMNQGQNVGMGGGQWQHAPSHQSQTMPQIVNNQGPVHQTASGPTASFHQASNFYNSTNRMSQRNQSLPPVNSGPMQNQMMMANQNPNHQSTIAGHFQPSGMPTQKYGQSMYDQNQMQYQNQNGSGMPSLNPMNGAVSAKRHLADNGLVYNPQGRNSNVDGQHPNYPSHMMGGDQMQKGPMMGNQAPFSYHKQQMVGHVGQIEAQGLSQGIRSGPHSGQQSKQGLPMIGQDNSMLSGGQQSGYSPQGGIESMDYFQGNEAVREKHSAAHRPELEHQYQEKQLRPGVEKEVQRGFFEIRKKYTEDGAKVSPKANRKDGKETEEETGEDQRERDGGSEEEQVQVYVSHICLHNYHPIFCKFEMNTVKIILHFSSIVYLNKSQLLYAPGFNDQFIYIVLFGKYKLYNSETRQQRGQTVNIGWTIGEEILFKATTEDEAQQTQSKVGRKEICKAASDGCVLGIEKKNLTQIKKSLYERGDQEEFSKLEIVLRGNHLVKQQWK